MPVRELDPFYQRQLGPQPFSVELPDVFLRGGVEQYGMPFLASDSRLKERERESC